MPHTTCDRPPTQELSQQYLNGNLSPAEMYQVENHLLESDFYFEAMEGLEQVPWDRCQQAVQYATENIREHFKIQKRARFSQNQIMVGAVILMALGIGAFWMINHKSDQPQDLTTQSNTASEIIDAADSSETDRIQAPTIDSTASTTGGPTPQNTVEKRAVQKERTPDVVQRTDAASNEHIAVGRIVNTRGDALQGIMVSAAGVTDQTDEGGYYALRVMQGVTTILLQHPDFDLEFEVDTSESWEIVVDMEQQAIIERYPINTGNRFK